MAYNQQAPYGASQGPRYADQRRPYNDSHATNNGYGGRGHVPGYDGRGQRAPGRREDGYERQEGPGYGRGNRGNHGAASYGNDGHYGGQERHRGGEGRPLGQSRQHQHGDRGQHGQNDPRGYGHPNSRQRPAADQYQQQDPYYATKGYGRPQEQWQGYGPSGNAQNGSSRQYDDGYEYEEPYYESQGQLPPTPQHGNQSHSRYDRHQPEQYQQHDHSSGLGQEEAPMTRQPASDPNHKQGQADYRSAEVPRNPKQLPKRITDHKRPPDSLSWDSPFPSFPIKPKTETNSRNASARPSLEEDPQRDRGPDNRSQTTNRTVSDGSSRTDRSQTNTARQQTGSNPQSRGAREPVQAYQSQYDDFEQHQHHLPRGVQGHATPQGSRPSDHESLQKVPSHDPRPPGIRSAHSEGNSAGLPGIDPVPVPGYERSNTMPAAGAQAVDNLPYRSTSDRKTSWQEPTAVTGYYGPADKNYLPTGSSSQPVWQSNGNASKYSNLAGTQQPSHRAYESQNSIGAFYDTYYEPHDQEIQPYRSAEQQKSPVPSEDDMPNFDAVPDGGHMRGMTIDDHLQPQDKARHILPPIPPQPQQYEQGNQYTDHHSTHQVPRSRSQPNLKNPRPPRPPQNNGFDFGVPSEPDRRPATAASNVDAPYGRPTPVDPRNQQFRPDPRPKPQGYPSQMSGFAQQSSGRPRPKDPYSVTQQDPAQNRPPPMPHDRSQDGATRQPPSISPSPSNPRGPPSNLPPNPDALPHHPPPVRPGLAEGPQRNQTPKPAPVRQYDAVSSPAQLSNPTQATKPSRTSGPLTHQELDQLRQRASRNPNDQALQLTLAKTLVAAGTELVDERADQKTRARTRDKFHQDGLRIVKKLSALGYPEAVFYLGDCYSMGTLGLNADIKEAFTCYMTAAKANHGQAAYRVAVCCEIGQEEGGGTKRDAVKAMQWYRRAATLGDTPAMYKMGIIQLKGLLGQPKNAKEAMGFLLKAAQRADKENPHALHELGLLYEKGNAGDGLMKDDAAAKEYFTHAATLGYKFSQFRLGCTYEYGLIGCPVDARQSIAWYSKAAAQGEHQSELALSGWYLTGCEGVLQQSDTEAYLWARKAATAGLAKAEYAMGYFTEVGIGAPANLEDAKRWYWRSASQNFPKARERLEDLRKGVAVKQKARVSRSAMKKQSDGECTIM